MTPDKRIISIAVVLLCIFDHSVAPPVTPPKSDIENDILDKIGVEYKRYLQEVVQTLESDKDFRERLEKAEDADLRSGKIAQELQFVKHDVRSKLDELKRAELERLRHLIRRQTELKHGLDSNQFKKVPDLEHHAGHIDHSNPHTFEIADLEKLIVKTTQQLAEVDKKRREEFKEYEMQKEFERNQEKNQLNDADREKFEKKIKEEEEALKRQAPQLHHPGSKKQLEEVWQYQDHLNGQDFDPKTFFFIHDVDGNGYLDHDEVKALFLRELQKLYNLGYPGEDLRERTEEMERMREHVFVEADTNRDGVISLQEWLDLTHRPDFNADPGWNVLEPRKEFTEEEYRQFERQRQQEIEALIAQGKLPRKTREQIQREAQYAHQAELERLNQQHYAQQNAQMGQVHPGQQYHPNAGYPQGQPVPQHGYPQQAPPQQLHQQVPPQQLHSQQIPPQQLHQQQQAPPQQLHSQQIPPQPVYQQAPPQQLHPQQVPPQQLHQQQPVHQQVPPQQQHPQQAPVQQVNQQPPQQQQQPYQEAQHQQQPNNQQAPASQNAKPPSPQNSPQSHGSVDVQHH